MSASAPLLTAWFATMDSADPDRVLDMITDDFAMSTLFSQGEGRCAEFSGDRAGLVGYLEQREKSTLVHHVDAGTTVDGTELVLGRTTRDGAFEASFNATAQVRDGKVRRLLICRTPLVSFA
jgi:ketosteroid isomerase-like protein